MEATANNAKIAKESKLGFSWAALQFSLFGNSGDFGNLSFNLFLTVSAAAFLWSLFLSLRSKPPLTYIVANWNSSCIERLGAQAGLAA